MNGFEPYSWAQTLKPRGVIARSDIVKVSHYDPDESSEMREEWQASTMSSLERRGSGLPSSPTDRQSMRGTFFPSSPGAGGGGGETAATASIDEDLLTKGKWPTDYRLLLWIRGSGGGGGDDGDDEDALGDIESLAPSDKRSMASLKKAGVRRLLCIACPDSVSFLLWRLALDSDSGECFVLLN